MLHARHRMRRSSEFAQAVKGSRAASDHLVVHVATTSSRAGAADDPAPTPATPARVGFVVSKAVGGAVERNRVKRRLRALMHDRLSTLAERVLVVIRARPGAATATFEQLRRDLDKALPAAISRASGAREQVRR